MARRPALLPESILRTALALVDAGGLSALTIRRLTAELGVTPMAVYRHFANKQAIVDGLVEVVIEQHIALPEATAGAHAALTQIFLSIRRALVAHPAVVPLLGASGSYGPRSLAIAEAVLTALRGVGKEPGEAVVLFHALVSYTIGSAALYSAAIAGGEGSEALRQRRAQVESLSAVETPLVVWHAQELARFASEEQFAAGLEALLASG
jgi:TetR/AcrR family transcriptional regulator, tetracycline repressor protein